MENNEPKRCNCGEPESSPNHHRSMFINEEMRCFEWMRKGSVETRCMDRKNHELNGFPHSLDFRGRTTRKYTVLCRIRDMQTPNGFWLPKWVVRNRMTGEIEYIFENDLVKASFSDPRNYW